MSTNRNETEKRLVDRVLVGDTSAFGTLMAPTEPVLRSFLQGQLRTRPDIAVDEVLQEVRIYLYRRLDRFNPEYPLRVFAIGLARNVVKRFLHRRSDLAPQHTNDDGESCERTDLSPMELEDLPVSLAEIMGKGRFGPFGASGSDRAGDDPPFTRTFLEVFAIFLRYGGFPHQQISFGFSILLWGKPKQATSGGSAYRAGGGVVAEKVPVRGDPGRVVREVGPLELARAANEMLEEITRLQRLDADYVRRVRRPLDRRLELTGAELFAKDTTSQKLFRHLLEKVTGGTRLREYFGRDQRRSVADWTWSLKERIKRAYQDPAARMRSPLPFTE
jgi:hypothetical protein